MPTTRLQNMIDGYLHAVGHCYKVLPEDQDSQNDPEDPDDPVDEDTV